MKRIAPFVCGVMALALALTGSTLAADQVTLEGSFIWARDDGDISGDLTAVMTPDGDNDWTVAFHFTWEDEPQTYHGTATGELGAGALKGTAESGDHRELSFRFSGEFEEGTFQGTHSFVQDDGSLREGGTLTLSMPE